MQIEELIETLQKDLEKYWDIEIHYIDVGTKGEWKVEHWRYVYD